MKILLLFVIFLSFWISAKSVVIETSDKVRYDNDGLQWKSSIKKRPIDAFLGIPYAEAPLGDLRFALPRPIAQPLPIYKVGSNGSHAYSVCTQMDFHEVVQGQEDCLHLNIYIPNIDHPGDKLLPVFFWIHGGGFFAGSGSPEVFGPEHLLDHDIILVTFNYRLGPLAFLTLETDEMPGNLGLHDQILALKWVQKNIEAFHGDANQVTIAGNSAGGMSVMFLLMSHAAQGLFSKAIIQSGPLISSYNVWDKSPKVYAKRLAKDLGCLQTNDQSMIDCLRKIPATDFADKTKHFLHYPYVGPNIWKPYFDQHVSSPIFLDDPETLLRQGRFAQVPIIIGTNADEGALNVVSYYDGRGDLNEVDKHWQDSLGPLILFHRSLDETTDWDKKMAKNIKDLYFGADNAVSKDNIKQFIKVSTDHMFFGGTEIVVRELAKKAGKNQLFRYMYSHHGALTVVDTMLQNKLTLLGNILIQYLTNGSWKLSDYGFGTCHADDLFVLFQPHSLPFNSLLTTSDALASERLIKYFVNFVINGDPNVGYSMETRWDPVEDADLHRYLEINAQDPPKMKFDPEVKTRCQFWAHIFDELYQMRLKKGLSQKAPLTFDDLQIAQKTEL